MSMNITGIRVPDSKMAREATTFIRDTESDLLFHHSSRVYYWAALAGQQRGLTVIAVLHDINMAARYCDYLVALRGGEMIAEGAPEALMRAETLEQIYGIPMGILPHPAGAAPVSFVY